MTHRDHPPWPWDGESRPASGSCGRGRTLPLMGETGLADLLRRVVAAEPSRPLVTFYDDAAGERIELSAKTFGNWVAKTANLLVDRLDAEPGGRLAVALPPHWQTAVWLFALWSAGPGVAP